MMPTFIITGSRITAATSPSLSASASSTAAASLNGTTIVVSQSAFGMPLEVGCVVYQDLPSCDLVADTEHVGLGDHGEQQRVVVAVVGALHLDDLVPAGGGARHTERVHRRLGP